MKNKKRIGLGLSGGGYRATAYHIGTLKKLNELGILENIDVISCISGGSILGAFYGLNKDNFEVFEEKAKLAVKKNVVGAVITSKWFYLALLTIILTSYITLKLHVFFFILWLILLLFIQFKLFPISKLIIKAYDKYFYNQYTLNKLPKKPIIAINTTNIESGRLFTFSRNKMSDSFYEYPADKSQPIKFKSEIFPISHAVMASTCVPFAFSPIKIQERYFEKESDYLKVHPLLIDGGIYDNQGIHKLQQKGSSYECDFIIISDAGASQLSSKNIRNQFILLSKTVDLLMNRIKNIQMSNGIFNNQDKEKNIVYQSLKWKVENCIDNFYDNLIKGKINSSTWEFHTITEKDIQKKDKNTIVSKLEKSIGYQQILFQSPSENEYKIATSVSTNLWSLKDKQINALIKCSSAITEIQIKLYFPQIINKKKWLKTPALEHIN